MHLPAAFRERGMHLSAGFLERGMHLSVGFLERGMSCHSLWVATRRFDMETQKQMRTRLRPFSGDSGRGSESPWEKGRMADRQVSLGPHT